MDKNQCCVMVYPPDRWGAFHPDGCPNNAIVEKDDKWYCRIHAPEYVAKKNAERQIKYDEKWAKRKIELSGHILLRACKDALKVSHDPIVEKILIDAINEAEGK